MASDLIELSTRHNFAFWLAGGEIFTGWARSASGSTEEGIARIEDGIRELRATGAMNFLPYHLGTKAEALHLADRTSQALEAIREAEALVARSGERKWCAELHRLKGVFLTALGADETQIEASFCAAISTAKEQKSISLEKRAKVTYAEYRRQKAGQEDVDSDYLFVNRLQRSAFRSTSRKSFADFENVVLENDRFREIPAQAQPLHRLRDLRFLKTFLETPKPLQVGFSSMSWLVSHKWSVS